MTVRAGKGDKDRMTVLPAKLVDRLREPHAADRAANEAGVWLPEALDRKYPGAGTSWGWFWLFPSRQVMHDPHSGLDRRHHGSSSRREEALENALVPKKE